MSNFVCWAEFCCKRRSKRKPSEKQQKKEQTHTKKRAREAKEETEEECKISVTQSENNNDPKNLLSYLHLHHKHTSTHPHRHSQTHQPTDTQEPSYIRQCSRRHRPDDTEARARETDQERSIVWSCDDDCCQRQTLIMNDGKTQLFKSNVRMSEQRFHSPKR